MQAIQKDCMVQRAGSLCQFVKVIATLSGQTPYSFEPKQLVIDLAAAEQLHIQLDDVKRNPSSSRITVSLRKSSE